MGVTVELNTHGLSRLIARFPDRVDAFVRTIAFRLVAAVMQRARVDTGFMRASVFAAVRGSSGRVSSQRAAFGAAKGKGKRRTIHHFTGGIGDLKNGEAAVAVGASYAPYVEAKHPFFAPAVKQIEGEWGTLLLALAAKIEEDGK